MYEECLCGITCIGIPTYKKVVNIMKCKRKTALICVVMLCMFSFNVQANNKVENNNSVKTENSTEVNIDEENITDKLETILDPDNDELEKEAKKTLDKYSSNWLVRFFQKIIDAISKFIDAVLKLASEAAKIGVD